MKSLFYSFAGVAVATSMEERMELRGQKMEAWIEKGTDEGRAEMIDEVASEMTMKDALSKIGDVHPTVALVAEKENDGFTVTEEHINSAREILNKLLLDSTKQLDVVVVDCMGQHEDNRVAYDQIMADLSYLQNESTVAKKDETSANEEIVTSNETIQKLTEDHKAAKRHYKGWKRTATAQLERLEAQANRVKGVLKLTGQLVDENPLKGNLLFMQGKGVEKCETEDGKTEFVFTDPKAQEKVDAINDEKYRKLFQNAMAMTVDGASVMYSDTDADSAESFLQVATPVKTKPNPFKQMRKCTPAMARFGLLHDNMATLIGKVVDDYIFYKREMIAQDKKFTDDLRNRSQMLEASRAKGMALKKELQAAIARQKFVAQERDERERSGKKLDQAKRKILKTCRKKMEKIMYEQLCGAKMARSEIQRKSKKVKPEQIKDCEFSKKWEKGDCTKKCDNTLEGGTRTLSRSIVRQANKYGMGCPELNFIQKCGRFPCPIDCQQTEWSGWSACSADCGTGAQSRGRDVVVEPKYGGAKCNGTEEIRKCNQSSCDKNCELQKFTKWSHCTASCGGGYKEKRRLVPKGGEKKGKGTCPGKNTEERRRTKKCNKKKCPSDLRCQAKVDMVYVLDSSGTVGLDNWRTIQEFANKMLDRYENKAFGKRAMKVGVVQYGNGDINDDGSLKDSIEVSPLTNDLKSISKKIKDLKHQRKFSNLAQALVMAKDMLGQGTARKSAQSAVMLITDGSSNFSQQVEDAAKGLDQANVQLNIVVIRPSVDDDLKFMRRIATTPVSAHLMHIKGFSKLKSQMKRYVVNVVGKTCPLTESPKLRKKMQKKRGFELVHRKKDCPCWWHDLSTQCPYRGKRKGHRCSNANQCYAKAESEGVNHFVFAARGWYKGKCYAKKKGYKGSECGCKEWHSGKLRKDAWAGSPFNHYSKISDDGETKAAGATTNDKKD